MFFELGSYAPWAAIALTAGVFVIFVLEVRSAEVVALGGAALALLFGLVTVEDLLKAIGNPAPATIGAMFVLSAALVRTGVLDLVSIHLIKSATTSPVLTLGGFFLMAGGASAFMNNTPVVIVLIPVVYAIAKDTGVAASRYLMPLSFSVILGGTCSLIGTSTNLLVDGVSRDLGLAPFSLFKIAPLGLILAGVGGGFLAIAAPRLIPERQTIADRGESSGRKSWTLDIVIPTSSGLIGKSLADIPEFKHGGGRVIDVIRNDASQRLHLLTLRIAAGDRVVLKTSAAEVMGFRDNRPYEILVSGTEMKQARQNAVIEVLVGPDSSANGRGLEDLGWRRKYAVYPMAVHRKGDAIVMGHLELTLRTGDTILLDGPREDIERLARDEKLIVLAPLKAKAFRRRKAPIAIAVLTGVVVGAAFNLAPILPLAIIGVAVVLMTNCIDPEEGIGAIDGRLLLLIVSMLVVGGALDKTGAMAMIIDGMTPSLSRLSPIWALAIIYAMTSIFTEIVTNNAVAVVMTPIAAGVALQLGLDPRPFVVAVMFGASASFATPIGYQTNTMVYNAGGYRFSDFLRIGIPMNLICGILTVLVAPFIWPLNS